MLNKFWYLCWPFGVCAVSELCAVCWDTKKVKSKWIQAFSKLFKWIHFERGHYLRWPNIVRLLVAGRCKQISKLFPENGSTERPTKASDWRTTIFYEYSKIDHQSTKDIECSRSLLSSQVPSKSRVIPFGETFRSVTANSDPMCNRYFVCAALSIFATWCSYIFRKLVSNLISLINAVLHLHNWPLQTGNIMWCYYSSAVLFVFVALEMIDSCSRVSRWLWNFLDRFFLFVVFGIVRDYVNSLALINWIKYSRQSSNRRPLSKTKARTSGRVPCTWLVIFCQSFRSSHRQS